MSSRASLLLALLLGTGAICSFAQNTTSDAKAMSILNQSLSASGAAPNQVHAFTASGTMIYFWAGQAIQSNATIRAKGGDQFRLDADVPGGTKSFAVSHRSGTSKAPDGNLSAIPVHNTLNAGILTFPYPSIADAMTDSKVTISYVGLVESGGRQFHQVRASRIYPKDNDPDGTLARLSAIDYFIDSQTLLVAKTSDLTHPKETLTESYAHDVEFEGYSSINGIAVPTVVREKVGGSTTWEFHLSNITFNSTLTDADFSLQ